MSKNYYLHLPADILNLVVASMLKFVKEYEEDIRLLLHHLYIRDLGQILLPKGAEGRLWGSTHYVDTYPAVKMRIESEIRVNLKSTAKSAAIIFGHEVGHVILDTSPQFSRFYWKLRNKFVKQGEHGVALEEVVETFAVKWVFQDYVYEQILDILEEALQKEKAVFYSGYCTYPLGDDPIFDELL